MGIITNDSLIGIESDDLPVLNIKDFENND